MENIGCGSFAFEHNPRRASFFIPANSIMSTLATVYDQVQRANDQLAQLSHDLYAALGNDHRSLQENLIKTRMEMLQACMAIARLGIANFEEEIDVVN
ncbi:hypothetical protein [Medusavirus stheno T3]|uniref:Uncharacterized protein n=1 Tax=Medusavirus stheno T3 TaxID=3069717 RepID=A0A7S7YER0_9VIRU|nr:hypothetical protein QKU73_gp331 [Acanthamoeba castellanii medusavirus]QPB44444.1 hypothetical protein [Medusavirus stheno T3]